MAKKRIQNLLKHVVCILLCLCVVLPFYMVLINSFKTKAEEIAAIEETSGKEQRPSKVQKKCWQEMARQKKSKLFEK